MVQVVAPRAVGNYQAGPWHSEQTYWSSSFNIFTPLLFFFFSPLRQCLASVLPLRPPSRMTLHFGTRTGKKKKKEGQKRNQQIPTMHTTLRRSCTACAKSKFGCDLRTPRCSRCVKRKLLCHYANEPLTATTSPVAAAPGMGAAGSEPGTWPAGDFTDSSNGLSSSSGTAASSNSSSPIAYYSFGSVDPFNSCPPTRLPTAHVQRLVHACMYIVCFYCIC